MKKILGLILIVFCFKLSAEDTTYVVLPEAQLKLLAVTNGGMGNLDCEIRWNPAYNNYYSYRLIYEFNNKRLIILKGKEKEYVQQINCCDLLAQDGSISPIKIITEFKGVFEIEIKNKDNILIKNIISNSIANAGKLHTLAPISNFIYANSDLINYGVTVTALEDCEVIIKFKQKRIDEDSVQHFKLFKNQSHTIERLLNNKVEFRFHNQNSTIEIVSNQPVLTTQYYFEKPLPDYYSFSAIELDVQNTKSSKYNNFIQLPQIDLSSSNYCKLNSLNNKLGHYYIYSKGENEIYIDGKKSIFTKDSLLLIYVYNYVELYYRNPIQIFPINLKSIYSVTSQIPINNFDSSVTNFFYRIEQKRIDSLNLINDTWEDMDLFLTVSNRTNSDAVNGITDNLVNKANKETMQGLGTARFGNTSRRWENRTHEKPIIAKKTGATGFTFTYDTKKLLNAPRGTYKIEVEVDCDKKITYIGYRGGTAKDEPTNGKSVAKTVQEYLKNAKVFATSSTNCPERILVKFAVL